MYRSRWSSAAVLVHPSFSTSKVAKSTSTRRWISDLLLRSGDSITYPSLVELRRRGLRNGNWRHLDSGQKALFRCALWVAKARGKITNTRLMVQVLRIVLKLLERFQSRIVKAGRARAAAMFEAYARPKGVFSWALRIREWLHDPKYIAYLGALELNT